MAAISRVSEEDMAKLVLLLEQAGLDAEAVSDILKRPAGIVRHELAGFALRVRRHSTSEEAWIKAMEGPWADWPGVTG